MRIVVAMSGGVDSSVAAALLAREGHEVDRPVDAALRPARGRRPRFGTLLHDRRSARRAARRGAPRHPALHRQLRAAVRRARRSSNFVREYAAGRTPIPCVHCNGDLKFATLVERAEGLRRRVRSRRATTRGWSSTSRRGRYRLKRGADAAEGPVVLPVHADAGAARARACSRSAASTRRAVREHARELGLPVAEKPDSQEICFVADGDHAGVRRARAADMPARARSATSRATSLGRHDGRPPLHRRPAQGPRPLLADPALRRRHRRRRRPRSRSARARRSSATTLTASRRELDCGRDAGGAGTRVTAQIRHRHREARRDARSARRRRARSVTFDEPQTAVAPGQAVVFYDGDVVVGGGWID